VVLHLILLHVEGSSNPLGAAPFRDFIRFYPKFIIKDIFGSLAVLSILLLLTIFWYPNFLGHPDNYIPANAMSTPPHIVPEFYFLPFYAILRSIPNKLLGVIAMFSSILILFILPLIDTYRYASQRWSRAGQFFFWLFTFNFLLLGWLGACAVEQPFIIVSQLSTVYYFLYFLFIIPALNFVEHESLSSTQNNN
jgi:quinol-cytochrome oxidoreductase complex cytochrome b subunit